MLRLFFAALMAACLTLTAHASESDIYGGALVPEFDSFPGICDVSKLAPADLRPGTDTWHFRTRIKDGTTDTCPNFNGVFNIVIWGCGTECQMGVIVDRTDGKIYPLPEVASGGVDYRADSALLIVNPEPSSPFSGDDIPEWLWRSFYEFKNGKFVLLYQDKGAQNTDILDTPHPVNPEILDEMSKDGAFDDIKRDLENKAASSAPVTKTKQIYDQILPKAPDAN